MIDARLKQQLQVIARRERRSLSSQIEIFLEQGVYTAEQQQTNMEVDHDSESNQQCDRRTA